jgi:hypothetical protein
LENEELLLRQIQTHDYIVADGEVIDRNNLKPERVIFMSDNGTIYDRQDTPPWYATHYQTLTQGIDAIDYTGWTNSIVAICGEKSFPIAINGAGDVIVAAAEFGAVSIILISKGIRYLLVLLQISIDVNLF